MNILLTMYHFGEVNCFVNKIGISIGLYLLKYISLFLHKGPVFARTPFIFNEHNLNIKMTIIHVRETFISSMSFFLVQILECIGAIRRSLSCYIKIFLSLFLRIGY